MKKLSLPSCLPWLCIFLVNYTAWAATPQVTTKTPLAELQLAFVNSRYQAYFHYNLATFKGLYTKEEVGRTYGDDPAKMWNPTGLDVDQWVDTVKKARMAGGWLTTKHHGGFCLWDSYYTDYDIATSSVKTDVVKVFVEAFRKAGLKVGLYYSILDYHHGVVPGQVTSEKMEFLKNQIRELLTNYGPIDYINFDGWSTWPTTPSFDDVVYPEIYKVVKATQPDCLIINHQYESNLAHAEVPFADAAGQPYPFHQDYKRPAAASDYIQKNWWWDDNPEFQTLRSKEYILKQLDSYNSHNAVYILNLAPNPAGRIDAEVIQRLEEVAAAWERPAEIEAPEGWGLGYDVRQNLAFLKPVKQSSTADHVGDKRTAPRAEIALDGVTEGRREMEQTSSTQIEDNAWWQVDLEQETAVTSIEIFHQTDGSLEGLVYRVIILNANGDAVWTAEKSDPSSTVAARFEVGGKQGRYVRIERRNHGRLDLAEVVVR